MHGIIEDYQVGDAREGRIVSGTLRGEDVEIGIPFSLPRHTRQARHCTTHRVLRLLEDKKRGGRCNKLVSKLLNCQKIENNKMLKIKYYFSPFPLAFWNG